MPESQTHSSQRATETHRPVTPQVVTRLQGVKRRFELRYTLAIVVALSLMSVPAARATVTYIKPSPGGGDGQVFVAANDGSNPRKIASGDWAAISPDGSRLAFVRKTTRKFQRRDRYRELRIVDLSSGAQRFVMFDPDNAYDDDPLQTRAVWSPDSRLLLAATDRRGKDRLLVFDATTGGTKATLTRSSDFTGFDFSPDSTSAI